MCRLIWCGFPAWAAMLLAALQVLSAPASANQPHCPEGSRNDLADRLDKKFKSQQCYTWCSGCGCKPGGSGYRAPPTPSSINPKGDCVPTRKLEVECGPAPYERCIREAAPLARKCALEARALGSNVISQEIVGQDTAGRLAVFDILLLEKGVNWPYGSDKDLEHQGSPFGPELLKETVRTRLSNARSVVAIGTASWEGDRKSQERLALKRAVEIATRLREIVPAHVEIWLLNLGQNTVTLPSTRPEETGSQRPALIAGVIDADDCVDLKDALHSALEQASSIRLNDYSLFDLSGPEKQIPPQRKPTAPIQRVL